DGHRVVEEGTLHLVLELDLLHGQVLVVALGGGGVGGVAHVGVYSASSSQMSRNRTSLAFVWMNFLRLSTSSPMSTLMISSASAASSTVICKRVRRSRSIVVSRNSSSSISPRPFSRANSFLWLGRSSRNRVLARSSLR